MKTRLVRAARGPQRGLTLVELLLATGLFSVLAFGLFGLLSDFLRLWNKSEGRRNEVERGLTVAELLAQDLRSAEAGPRGDFVVQWVGFDTDGDNVIDTNWPRLRFVRTVAAAELQRSLGATVAPGERALLEVLWTVLPATRGPSEVDRRAQGVLLRGARIRGGGGPSIFDDAGFFSAAGTPLAGATQDVSSGLLWFGLRLASQTSDVLGGSTGAWKLGTAQQDCSTAWDAFGRARPDAARHAWNDGPHIEFTPGALPRLPRRVWIELEFEHAEDLKQRTRLSLGANATQGELELERADRAGEIGDHVKIDAEWMQITQIAGRKVWVRRAQRGTQAAAHEAGRMVHRGRTEVREVPLAVNLEDWNLAR